MEMFQNEVINIQELKKYTNPLNEDIARLERELKLISSEIKEKDVLQKELSKKPINVDTLNVRVDTARDLVFKLHNTTSQMVKMALLSEYAIVAISVSSLFIKENLEI